MIVFSLSVILAIFEIEFRIVKNVIESILIDLKISSIAVTNLVHWNFIFVFRKNNFYLFKLQD